MVFKPMTASHIDFTRLFGKKHNKYLSSPKMDGIRALLMNGNTQSRSGKPLRNLFIQDLFSTVRLNDCYLDGELMNSEDGSSSENFSKNIDGIMSISRELPNLRYFVFDRVDPNNLNETAIERYNKLLSMRSILPEWVVIVEKKIVSSKEEIMSEYMRCMNDGYEGSMIQDINGRYKNGKSTAIEGLLLKVKETIDSECIVTGFNNLFVNNNETVEDSFGNSTRSSHLENLESIEMLGSLKCTTLKSEYFEEGIEFKIGSGFSMSQREAIWASRDKLIGKLVTYKFLPHGVKDAPRCPIFKGFRDRDDMDTPK